VSLEQFKTQVLLLHSEQRTLELLSKGFSDRYSVHCATSGTEALNTLGDTPIDVLVCKHKMPGMSGLEALREARKRSPHMVGILLAGSDKSDGLEAMVGEQELFQIIRGEISPNDLQSLVETTTKRIRLMGISQSANDTKADVDVPFGENIVMETAENGSAIVSDGTGTMPALKPERIQTAPNARGREIDVLVLTKDDDFLATIKESSRSLHDIHHANTPAQAEEIAANHKIGVLVTDAAMVGSKIEVLTQKLRLAVPRLVAIVAGRRDDGELLMDLINRGHVYRFLLKPVSPGRVRLAIEASVKHHLDAADSAFKGQPKTAASPVIRPTPAPRENRKNPVARNSTPIFPQRKPKSRAQISEPIHAPVRQAAPPESAGLDSVFDDDGKFSQTMTNIAISVGKKLSGASDPDLDSDVALPVDRTYGDAVSNDPGLKGKPKLLAGIAGVAVVAVATIWFMSSGSDLEGDSGVSPVVDQRESSQPSAADQSGRNAREEIVPPVSNTVSLKDELLQKARDAQAAGEITSPAGRNAMEFYIAALNEAPGDAAIAAQLDALTEEVFGLAEGHLLAKRSTEAARALRVIGLADPGSSRLNFLNVQLEQLQLRNLLDEARFATANSNFEDASLYLSQAAIIAGSNTTELNALTEQLTSARIEKYGSLELADEARVAAEQAEDDRVAAAAAQQAEDDRIAVEAAAARQAEDERIVAEAAAARQAEDDRIAAVAAAARQAEDDRIATVAAAARQAEDDRIAAVAAAASQAEDDRIAAQAVAAKKAEDDRIAAEAAAAQRAESDRLAAIAASAAASSQTAASQRVTEAISAVKRIHYVAPKYPRSAQRRDITGWVDLSFTVTTSGEVADIEVMATEPGTIFNDAATTALEQWRFEPAMQDGQPVEKRIALRLSFNLQ
jgi:TonB family protein